MQLRNAYGIIICPINAKIPDEITDHFKNLSRLSVLRLSDKDLLDFEIINLVEKQKMLHNIIPEYISQNNIKIILDEIVRIQTIHYLDQIHKEDLLYKIIRKMDILTLVQSNMNQQDTNDPA